MDANAKKLREEAESALGAGRRLDVDPAQLIAALDRLPIVRGCTYCDYPSCMRDRQVDP